ncbi:MAG: hypothetical protein AAB535_02220 [Patescibacteria group bacterium]
MKKDHWIHKIHLPNWLVGILALVLILRIPTFFEPYYYGDEMIYMTLGQGIRQGLPLYSEMFDNKPPLLYLTAAIAGNLFWFKTILAFWSLATTVAFWKLVKGKMATLIFALLISLPLLEGNTANAELFMIGPTILAFYMLLTKKLTIKNLIISGFLFGIAALFKIPASFEVPTIVVFWVITQGMGKWRTIFKNTFYLFVGFIIPILLTFIWYFIKGGLKQYVEAAFLQNVGYIGSWGVEVPLPLRAGLIILGVLLLFVVSKKISKDFLFACLWLIFSLFAVTLSGRPYPHYLVQSVGPIAILLGMFFTSRNIEQALVVIPLTVAFFIPIYYNFYHYKTRDYYLRFVNFTTGKISRATYFDQFSPNTQRNYKIADFLIKSSLPHQRVFIWDSDSPTIYALSRRLPPIKFVADYHINDYYTKTKLVGDLAEKKPRFIVLTSKHPLPEIMNFIRKEYILIHQIEDANIYSKLETITL